MKSFCYYGHFPTAMLHPQLIANTASSVETASQTTTDPISFQTALLVIIAGALVFLAKNLASVNNRLTSVESGKKKAVRTPESTNSARQESADLSIPVEVVAAISAAIHTTLKGRHRIISVGQICPNRQAWSAEGRRQVFSSHKVR